jgi:RimJ/RimL family protein N-acetyltransferase
MAQIKIYGNRAHLDRVKAELSDVIHGCVVEALSYPADKRAHRFFAKEKKMGTIEPQTYILRDGTSLLVRAARAEDAARLAEMKNAIIAEDAYTLAGPGEHTATAERLERTIAEHADEPGYLYLVAEAGGQVVGELTFSNGHLRKTAHAGQLSVYLGRDWRERGVGSILLRRLLEWAAAHPTIEKVGLAVFSDNSRALAAYRKAGFVEEGRCPRDMKLASGEYVDSVLMYQFVK